MEWRGRGAGGEALATNRLGLMGHYYSGMLDVATDLTQVCITFGSHVEILEVDELSALARQMRRRGSERARAEFREEFDVQRDCSGRGAGASGADVGRSGRICRSA